MTPTPPLPNSPAARERAAMLDRLYQHINRLDDASLASLEALIDEGGSYEFVEEAPSTRGGTGRRAFLLALLTGGAAIAGGGATALFMTQGGLPTKTAAPLVPTLQGSPVPTRPPASPTPDPALAISGLRDELAAARTEQLTLRAELDTTRQQADQLATTVQARENDIAYLQQVIALYDQMEAVGLDNTVATGLSPVNVALLALATARGLLSAGVRQAAALLATVEVQAPAIANGLIWLENQVNGLAGALQTLEDALSNLVEPVMPVAQQVGTFINQVLDLLPFGAGENIRAGLQAIAAIMTHIPELVASINPMVITPLRQWISPDDGKGLVAEVVEPISANLIAPAQRMVDDTATLETAFHNGLKTPVEDALAARATLRQELYRITGVS